MDQFLNKLSKMTASAGQVADIRNSLRTALQVSSSTEEENKSKRFIFLMFSPPPRNNNFQSGLHQGSSDSQNSSSEILIDTPALQATTDR